MPAADPPGRSSAGFAAILLGTAGAVLVSIAVAGQWLLVGSVSGGWFYGYAQPFSLHILVLSLGVSAAVGALLWRMPAERSPRADWMWLLVWLGLALAAQGALRFSAPFPLERIFVSDSANSFYSVTQRHEPADVLRHFNRVRSEAPLHAQSNMPGKTMVLYALERMTPRTDVLPWLLVLISNLGALLVYVFARDVLADRKAALIAAVLYLFVPARIYFLPLMNTVTPVIVLACAVVLLRWMRTGRTAWAVVFGLALYGLVFFEPLPLVIGVLFAGLVAAAMARGEIKVQRFVLQACAAIAAFIAVTEAMTFVFGFELIGGLRRIASHAVEFNVQAQRPYAVWVYANLAEFAFAMGVCQAVLFAAAVVGVLRRRGRRWREAVTQPAAVVTLGLLATVLATDAIGVNRGEVIRLWMFLACFCQVPAAYVCTRLPGMGAAALAGFSTALQAAVGSAMIEFVLP